MSVLIKGNNKASRLFIGGKDIAKAYYNGDLIFRKGGISFGTLIYNQTSTGVRTKHEITELADFNKLFGSGNASGPREIDFSFDTVNSFNIIGWNWNTSKDSQQLYQNTIIKAGFLYGMPNLNSDINIPNWITSIQDNFLMVHENMTAKGNISQFNGNIRFGKNLTNIGNNFMHGANRFNKPINTNNVTQIGNGFLSAITGYGDNASFNQSVTLPNVERIGDGLLEEMNFYNSPLIFSDNLISVGDILKNCTSFNTAITLPSSLQTIGGLLNIDKLNKNMIFNKDLVIPANCTITGNILTNPRRDNLNDTGISYNSTLTLSAGVSLQGKILGYLRSNVTPTLMVYANVSDLLTNTGSVVFNNIGDPFVYVGGPNAQAFIDSYTNIGTNYGKRKLVLAS